MPFAGRSHRDSETWSRTCYSGRKDDLYSTARIKNRNLKPNRGRFSILLKLTEVLETIHESSVGRKIHELMLRNTSLGPAEQSNANELTTSQAYHIIGCKSGVLNMSSIQLFRLVLAEKDPSGYCVDVTNSAIEISSLSQTDDHCCFRKQWGGF